MSEPVTEPTVEKHSSRVKFKLIAAAVLAVLLLFFILSNGQSVEVSYMTADGRAPLWVVLLATALIGGMLGQVIEATIRRSRRERRDK